MHFSSPVSRQRIASLIARADGVRGFRGGDDALGGGEQPGRLEALDLVEGRRLDDAQRRAQADHRGHAVVAQPAGVDARRHEAVAQREHLDQRRQLGRVAEVVAVLAAAHRRAGVRLAGHEADLLAFQLVADEGEGQAGEVAAAAHAADHHVGEVARTARTASRPPGR